LQYIYLRRIENHSEKRMVPTRGLNQGPQKREASALPTALIMRVAIRIYIIGILTLVDNNCIQAGVSRNLQRFNEQIQQMYGI